ncbi:MAG: hypothetical protein HRT45_19335 [Bdellovibrionales bacterium]|nr:hypothetical protein [Bdellovibrionales bacterium]
MLVAEPEELVFDRYMSTYAGMQVEYAAQEIAEMLEARRGNVAIGSQYDLLFDVPTLSIDTPNDPVIDDQININLMSELRNGQSLVLPVEGEVEHKRVASPVDEGNPRGDWVFEQTGAFLLNPAEQR